MSHAGLPKKFTEDFIFKRKFKDPIVEENVEKWLGDDYRRILIFGSYGRTKPDENARNEVIKNLEAKGVSMVKFEEILRELYISLETRAYSEPSLRMLQYIKFLLGGGFK